MAFIDVMMEKARADKKTIVLPESMDHRTYEAAEKIVAQDIANLVIIGTPEEIEAERRQLRYDLLDLFWRPFDEYKVQMRDLVDRAMATIWFEDLLDNATDMMLMYERGPKYKKILDNYYFHPNPNSITKTERMYDCGFKTTSSFYDWLEEAVTLFGVEAWIHLKNNEYKDIAKGFVPYHDIFPDNLKIRF